MRRYLLAAPSIALLLVATPLVAQPGTVPGQPDRTRVVAGTYKVDPGHTQVLFTVNHQGFSEYTGQFTQPSGTMTLDPAHPEQAKVEVTFPIDKVSTTVPALDAHLKTPDFFDAAKFPEGKFVTTSVRPSGTNATIVGDLTFHGVTKPVTLQARFYGAGKSGREGKPTVGFQATGTIKRSDWGMSFIVPIVSDEVKLTINAAFVQQ